MTASATADPEMGAASRSGRLSFPIAGFASTAFGLHVTTVVYSAGVAALGLVALAAQGMRSARRNED